MKLNNTAQLSLIPLILLITGAIDSVRNLPATALFGSALIFFFIAAAIMFLLPVAFVSAELASSWSEEEGGVYSWVRHAFGEKWAFLTIWLQWINTLVWYPSILSFLAGTAAYFFSPELAEQKWYIISVILVVFWGMTFLSLRGVAASAKFASWCAVLGMIIPMGLIIGLGLHWLFSGQPLNVHFSFDTIIPNFSSNDNWISLTAIITSFLGMELAAVHVTHVHNPKKNFPKAVLYSVIFILLTMGLGSLAIAFVLPQKDISLVSGVMQAFQAFFAQYHALWAVPVMTVLLLIGSLGGMTNWIIAPVKGLMVAAEHGFLPRKLTQKNAKGAPKHLLIAQALVVTVFCTVFLLIPSVNGIYWLFTALSTQLYMLMYVLMFCAAIQTRRKFPNLLRTFKVPGGRIGFGLTCVLGLLGCIITLIVGFIPPSMLDIGSVWRYESIFCIGFVGLLLPCLLFYYYQKKTVG